MVAERGSQTDLTISDYSTWPAQPDPGQTAGGHDETDPSDDDFGIDNAMKQMENRVTQMQNEMDCRQHKIANTMKDVEKFRLIVDKGKDDVQDKIKGYDSKTITKPSEWSGQVEDFKVWHTLFRA